MKSALIFALILVETLAVVGSVEVKLKSNHGLGSFSGSEDNGFIRGPNGNSQNNAGQEPGCSPVVAARNKVFALGFINEVLGDKNISALDKYVAKEQYIQHNPDVEDGLDGVKKAMTVWFKDAPNKVKMDVRRISCECDLCWAHIKRVTNDDNISGTPVAQVDIFRMCPQYQGKLCEHWDVIQTIPPRSANSHPMF